MYTQCPECSTVFRITAETLRAARGRVRCGICSTTFSALDHLSEHPSPGAGAELRDEDTITVEEVPGTEVIELGGGAGDAGPDEPVEAAGPGAAAAMDDRQETTGPDGDESLDAIPDAALEFHGSAEDLERLFIEAGGAGTVPADERGPDADLGSAIEEIALGDFAGIEVRETDLPWPDTDGAPGSVDPGTIAAVLAFSTPLAASKPEAPHHDDVDTGPADREPQEEPDLDRTDEYPVLVIDEMQDAGSPAVAGEVSQPDEEATESRETVEGSETGAPGRGDEGREPAPQAAQETWETPPIPIPDELRRDAARSAAEEFAAPSEFEEPAGPRRWPMLLAAVLLGLMLAAQAIHHWREDLARDPALGPWLLGVYAALGLDAPAPVDLAAFELRQLGAASEPSQAGRIKVRASIVNRAPFAQPYPLLRLTLQDRFGSTIGARELEPAQYLPGGATSASGLLAPSQRADAELVFVDPGREAVGFELDVCVVGATGLRCGADLPQGRQ